MELQQLPLPGGKLNTLRVFRSASVRHESQGRGAEVTDFGDFPPAFHALLFTYNVRRETSRATRHAPDDILTLFACLS